MKRHVHYAKHLGRKAHTINCKGTQTLIFSYPNSTSTQINNLTNFEPTQTHAPTSTMLMNWNRTPTTQLITQPLELNLKTTTLATTPSPRNFVPPRNPRLLSTPCHNHTKLTPSDKCTIASTHNATSNKHIKKSYAYQLHQPFHDGTHEKTITNGITTTYLPQVKHTINSRTQPAEYLCPPKTS